MSTISHATGPVSPRNVGCDVGPPVAQPPASAASPTSNPAQNLSVMVLPSLCVALSWGPRVPGWESNPRATAIRKENNSLTAGPGGGNGEELRGDWGKIRGQAARAAPGAGIRSAPRVGKAEPDRQCSEPVEVVGEAELPQEAGGFVQVASGARGVLRFSGEGREIGVRARQIVPRADLREAAERLREVAARGPRVAVGGR